MEDTEISITRKKRKDFRCVFDVEKKKMNTYADESVYTLIHAACVAFCDQFKYTKVANLILMTKILQIWCISMFHVFDFCFHSISVSTAALRLFHFSAKECSLSFEQWLAIYAE